MEKVLLIIGYCKYNLRTNTRAVTNFSSRRGIVKSSRGTKKVWCAAAEAGGGGGYGGG